jgi:presenilin-like A22 family membrane protease
MYGGGLCVGSHWAQAVVPLSRSAWLAMGVGAITGLSMDVENDALVLAILAIYRNTEGNWSLSGL